VNDVVLEMIFISGICHFKYLVLILIVNVLLTYNINKCIISVFFMF
jgi:hypothetical protein